MRGLRKYLTPFAPDQSGASSVIYELGGITVICDAGGCAGNVCGFDEPRWFTMPGAIFSAGLRDMDAILGRDDQLVGKLVSAADKLDAKFAAIIGTPVPSVIATDYKALTRMAEKRVDIPVVAIDTNGMDLYDRGAEKAYLEMFKKFAKEKLPVEKGLVGVIGVNPLDISRLDAPKVISDILKEKAEAKTVWCYGMESGLEAFEKASCVEKNIVVSASGLKAAKYLEKQFNTPYEVYNPLAEVYLSESGMDFKGKKILAVTGQIIGNSMREYLLDNGADDVRVATWFELVKELSKPEDIHLSEEDDFEELVMNGDFDILIGDPTMWKIVPEFEGKTIGINDFAISGKLV